MTRVPLVVSLLGSVLVLAVLGLPYGPLDFVQSAAAHYGCEACPPTQKSCSYAVLLTDTVSGARVVQRQDTVPTFAGQLTNGFNVTAVAVLCNPVASNR